MQDDSTPLDFHRLAGVDPMPPEQVFIATPLRQVRRARPESVPHGVFAALELHPDLNPAVGHMLEDKLGLHDGTSKPARFAPEQVIFSSESAQDTVFLIVSGKARGVFRQEGARGARRGRNPIFAFYRAGLWAGLPAALVTDNKAAPVLRHYEVVATGPVEAIPVAVSDLRSWCARYPILRAFVAQQVSRRFGASRFWVERLREHPLLSLLEPADLAWLVQLGTVRRYVGDGSQPYMKAGGPVDRVSIVLEGGGQGYLPDGERSVLVCEYEKGELMGHEELATPEELDGEPIDLDVRPDPMATAPPNHRTDVYLARGTVVMAWDWRAFRWLLYEKKQVWSQVKDALRPGLARPSVAPMPIVAFYGARQGLGTATLAHGTAVALAREVEEERPVWLIDVQRPGALLDLNRSSSTEIERLRGDLVDGTDDDFDFLRIWIKVGQGRKLAVAWCQEVEETASLVRFLRHGGRASVIVLAGPVLATRAQQASDRGEPLAEEMRTAHRMAEDINELGCTAVWVTDDPYTPYGATSTRPQVLIRAERFTEDFIRTEQIRARIGIRDWLTSMRPKPGMSLLSNSRRVVEELGFYNDAAEEDRSVRRAERVHHILRVPDYGDELARIHTQGLDAAFGQRNPMTETFERLARMLRGRTVGIALGGGGAWGFTQIALLKSMEEARIPIDYISGTSFGAVVAGLYAAGGLAALEKLLDWTTERPALVRGAMEIVGQISETTERFGSALGSRLTYRVLSAALDNRQLQTFINDILFEVTGRHQMPLSLTRIPFLPVGTSLTDGMGVVQEFGTVGFGVRTASCLPPLFPSLGLGTDRIIDGGLVALVPTEAVRLRGADFVIGCNVVPPNPPSMAVGNEVRRALARLPRPIVRQWLEDLEGLLAGFEGSGDGSEPAPEKPGSPGMAASSQAIFKALSGQIGDFVRDHSPGEHVAGAFRSLLLGRLLDTLHGFYLLSWRSGQDQAALTAQYIISMQPEDFQSFQFWRGREIVETFKGHLDRRDPPLIDELRELWLSPERWHDVPPQIVIGDELRSLSGSAFRSTRSIRARQS